MKRKNSKGHLTREEGRVCIKCEEFKEWSSFSKSKGGHNGRRGTCKECANRIQRDRARKKQVKPKVYYKIEVNGRECTRCRKFKDWEAFNKEPDCPNGRSAR